VPPAKREDQTDAHRPNPLTKEQNAELAAWRKAHRRRPSLLRHNATAGLWKPFGIEAGRIMRGRACRRSGKRMAASQRPGG